MAPISDETVSALKDTIHKLESRVAELESRLVDGAKSVLPSSSIRMVLMGPPGAGT